MNIANAITLSAHTLLNNKNSQENKYTLHLIKELKGDKTEDEIVCLILHDVIIDGQLTVEDLRQRGLTETQAEALTLLTPKKGDKYLEYVAKLGKNDLARRVKIANLKFSLQPERITNIPEKGVDQYEMEWDVDLYRYAFYGLSYGYYKYDWFLRYQELFSENHSSYKVHHDPTNEDWLVQALEFRCNFVYIQNYSAGIPATASLSCCSSVELVEDK